MMMMIRILSLTDICLNLFSPLVYSIFKGEGKGEEEEEEERGKWVVICK